MDTSQMIASKIKYLSKQQKKPINKMLLECGMNRNFIYDLEKKEAIPSVDKLIRIAGYFTVSLDYLLGLTDIPTVAPPQGEVINKNVEENEEMKKQKNNQALNDFIENLKNAMLNEFGHYNLAENELLITDINEAIDNICEDLKTVYPDEPHKTAIEKYFELNQEHQDNIRKMIDMFTQNEEQAATSPEAKGKKRA